MPHPHKLPKPGKMLSVFALYAIGYTTIFWFGQFGFPELSAEVSLRLAQIGILTVYSAASLGGLSFFWSAKAKENSSIAVHRISNIDFQIGLLTQLQSEASLNSPAFPRHFLPSPHLLSLIKRRCQVLTIVVSGTDPTGILIPQGYGFCALRSYWYTTNSGINRWS